MKLICAEILHLSLIFRLQELDEYELDAFFGSTLPFIVRLAFRLPEIIPSSIPLLRSGRNKSISLSQEQIACILANAFLCTFPHRNEDSKSGEFENYPSVNFSNLFNCEGSQNAEKLKCICHYFLRVSEKSEYQPPIDYILCIMKNVLIVCKIVPTGVVTFTRYSIPEDDLPDWDTCDATFDEKFSIHVCDDGTIEDDGRGMLQVDFANKYFGGGVLGQGCVQEEILFMIYPELLCGRLFTEALADNECLIILGCERFNYYNGYSTTFQWAGNFIDRTFVDPFRRRNSAIVALDAIRFKTKAHQYKEENLKRELNKVLNNFRFALIWLCSSTQLLHLNIVFNS